MDTQTGREGSPTMETTATPLQACYRYLNLLRNAPKRRYGFTYVAWLRNGAVGVEPERPKGLSFMGAQAVRLAVADFKLWG